MGGWWWAMIAGCGEVEPAGPADPGALDAVAETGIVADSDSGTVAHDSDTGSGTACAPGRVIVDDAVRFDDLQQALYAASAGSVVRACEGTYVGAFVAWVPITLVAEGEVTLDGGDAGTTLTVVPGTTIRGITVTGGHGTDGGGIAVEGPGELTVEDCVITLNRADGAGGGLRASGATVWLSGTDVVGNEAGSGGGIDGFDAEIYLGDSTVRGNSAVYGGGGLHLRNAIVSQGTVSDNVADSGGGIEADGTGSIRSVAVTGNAAAEDGGGISLPGTFVQVDLVDLTITGNTSGGSGGGLSVFGSSPVLDGVVVSDNVARDGGGAAVWVGTMVGGEFSGNEATGVGGGLYLRVGASAVGASIHDNIAVQGGGGVAVELGAVISASTITANTTAGSGGGVLFVLGAVELDLRLTGVTIEGNAATEGGGVHAVGENWLTVDQTVLRNNVADRGAGAYTGGGMWVQAHGSVFEGNVATEAGGGLFTTTGDGIALTSSEGTRWTDNQPDDVHLLDVSYQGYGDVEFSCVNGVCDSPP